MEGRISTTSGELGLMLIMPEVATKNELGPAGNMSEISVSGASDPSKWNENIHCFSEKYHKFQILNPKS